MQGKQRAPSNRSGKRSANQYAVRAGDHYLSALGNLRKSSRAATPPASVPYTTFRRLRSMTWSHFSSIYSSFGRSPLDIVATAFSPAPVVCNSLSLSSVSAQVSSLLLPAVQSYGEFLGAALIDTLDSSSGSAAVRSLCLASPHLAPLYCLDR